MKLSLHNRVENFLDAATYLSFVHREQPYSLTFMFDEPSFHIFKEQKGHEDVRDFFRGRKLKLIIYTDDNTGTNVSLVDTDTADTIRLKNPKFIKNNIYFFAEAKLPEDSEFVVNFLGMGKSQEGKKMWAIHHYWGGKKLPKIHGYSLTDTRSK